ncbi:MAG: ankyrin repeat domain-containing protein, partial [Acidobacteriota bacterium]|nr:ankyrin repeat domain-containing protein [Acidobacteriota bacterium]
MRTTRTVVTVTIIWLAALARTAAAVEAPVAEAVMRHDREAVYALIDAGADVDTALGDGMTGLHWAALHGDVEITRLLLDAGATIEATTRLGSHTPLHVASRSAHAGVATTLIKAGANPLAITSTGATPLHFAAQAGHPGTIRALLEHGVAPDPREPVWGQTPLMFAAAAARVEAIETLLSGGADPSLTARVIDITARNEADQVDSRRRRTRSARRPSDSFRARPRNPRSRPGWPAPRRTGQTPATDTAPSSRSVRTAAGAENNLQEEPEPLGFADLVGSHGGLTALLLATRDGHTDAALALIAAGADIDQVSAADGTSPLLIATINGHFDLAMQLIALGADPTLPSQAGATPLYGALNMQWAPKARHPQPTDYQQQKVSYLELMTALLEAGADVNSRLTKSLWYTTYNRDLLGVDRTGATTFWRAAYALDIPAMRLLLAYGANPNRSTLKVPSRRRPATPDPSGLPPTPLGEPAVSPLLAASGVGYGQGFAGNSHRHVEDGWLSAVRFLVEELGANVHARDHNGYNAIHHAAARGDNQLIMYLVDQGVDVNQVSRRGQTTADMANGPVQRTQPFPDTVALLESLGA